MELMKIHVCGKLPMSNRPGAKGIPGRNATLTVSFGTERFWLRAGRPLLNSLFGRVDLGTDSYKLRLLSKCWYAVIAKSSGNAVWLCLLRELPFPFTREPAFRFSTAWSCFSANQREAVILTETESLRRGNSIPNDL